MRNSKSTYSYFRIDITPLSKPYKELKTNQIYGGNMRIIIFFVVILSAATAFAQSTMNIMFTDGTQTTYTIGDVSSITFENVTSIEDLKNLTSIVNEFRVLQNYPNPFNPSTSIEYYLPDQGLVKINIFNINGELINTVTNGYQSAGQHKTLWDGTNESGMKVASGLYIYRVAFNQKVISKKMLLIK
ncbi:flagellar basal body rod modification protein [bacterium BMS3Abin03]|nr:flagellar basal body rod modification protein [bacterium BMS3Abin03]